MANLSFSNDAYNPPKSSGAGLKFANYDSKFSIWDTMGMGADSLSMGQPVQTAGNFNPAAGVNTTQVDGQASFFDSLAGFGQAMLGGIGVQPERAAQAQPAFWGQPEEPKGIDTETLVVFGLVGVGVYFLFKQ